MPGLEGVGPDALQYPSLHVVAQKVVPVTQGVPILHVYHEALLGGLPLDGHAEVELPRFSREEVQEREPLIRLLLRLLLRRGGPCGWRALDATWPKSIRPGRLLFESSGVFLRTPLRLLQLAPNLWHSR